MFDYIGNHELEHEHLNRDMIARIIAQHGGIKGWSDDNWETMETKRARGQLINITVDTVDLQIDATSTRSLEEVMAMAPTADDVDNEDFFNWLCQEGRSVLPNDIHGMVEDMDHDQFIAALEGDDTTVNQSGYDRFANEIENALQSYNDGVIELWAEEMHLQEDFIAEVAYRNEVDLSIAYNEELDRRKRNDNQWAYDMRKKLYSAINI